MELKERVEQFKRDCRSNNYHTQCIIECNERLEEIANKLYGLGSPTPKDVQIENGNDPYKNNKLYWMCEEEKYINERYDHIKAINEVNNILNKIINPLHRQMIVELYITKDNHQDIADKYHYNRQHMYKVVDKIIKSIL